jgi:hypothetical protein
MEVVVNKKPIVPVEAGQIRIDPHRWEGHGDTKREVQVLVVNVSKALIQTVNEQRVGYRDVLLDWPAVWIKKDRLECWPLKVEDD